MAYSYSAWASQSTDAARLTMLRLHHAEVTLEAGPDVSADGKSVGRAGVIAYLRYLSEQIGVLEGRTGARAPSVAVADLR